MRNMVYKGWFDGTTAGTRYKQKFDADANANTDADIFMVSLVPLQLRHFTEESKDAIMTIWQNPRPSSTLKNNYKLKTIYKRPIVT